VTSPAEQWADLILRVNEADHAGRSYSEIAEQIIQPHPLHGQHGLVHSSKRRGYRQLARLYIMLARWHRGAAPLPPQGVEIGGRRFRDPVVALRSGVGTLTVVYKAFERAWRRERGYSE